MWLSETDAGREGSWTWVLVWRFPSSGEVTFQVHDSLSILTNDYYTLGVNGSTSNEELVEGADL